MGPGAGPGGPAWDAGTGRAWLGAVGRDWSINLGAVVALAALSLAVVPLLIRVYGLEAYGAVSLAWACAAHMAWLDLGLTGALRQQAAGDLASGRSDSVERRLASALALHTATGVLFGMIAFAAAEIAADTLGSGAEHTRLLAVLLFRTLGLALPIELVAGALTGVLEAGGRFDRSARALVGGLALGQGVAVAGAVTGVGPEVLAASLLTSRVVRALLLAQGVKDLLGVGPLWRLLRKAAWHESRALLAFGGWTTLSGAASAVVAVYERWLVAAVVGIGALPYYSIPLAIVDRLCAIPGTAARSVAPRLASLSSTEDWAGFGQLTESAFRATALAMGTTLFVGTVWGAAGLQQWLGVEFARQATLPAMLILWGLVLGLPGLWAGTATTAAGRPDAVARAHVLELPVILALTTVCVDRLGVTGAAVAFLLRCVLDAGTQWWFMKASLPVSLEPVAIRGILRLAPGATMLGLGAAWLRGSGLGSQEALLGTMGVLVAFVPAAWWGLAPTRRSPAGDGRPNAGPP